MDGYRAAPPLTNAAVVVPRARYTDLISGNATLGLGPTPTTSVQTLIANYLNRADVQAALHAKPATWVACCAERGQSGTPCLLNYTTSFPDMMPLYVEFFEQSPNLRVLIYSGGACLGGLCVPPPCVVP